MTFKIGDRVEMATDSGSPGTIEYVDAEHVRVRWDDGKTGLLYDHRDIIPSLHRLVKLKLKDPNIIHPGKDPDFVFPEE